MTYMYLAFHPTDRLKVESLTILAVTVYLNISNSFVNPILVCLRLPEIREQIMRGVRRFTSMTNSSSDVYRYPVKAARDNRAFMHDDNGVNKNASGGDASISDRNGREKESKNGKEIAKDTQRNPASRQMSSTSLPCGDADIHRHLYHTNQVVVMEQGRAGSPFPVPRGCKAGGTGATKTCRFTEETESDDKPSQFPRVNELRRECKLCTETIRGDIGGVYIGQDRWKSSKNENGEFRDMFDKVIEENLESEIVEENIKI